MAYIGCHWQKELFLKLDETTCHWCTWQKDEATGIIIEESLREYFFSMLCQDRCLAFKSPAIMARPGILSSALGLIRLGPRTEEECLDSCRQKQSSFLRLTICEFGCIRGLNRLVGVWLSIRRIRIDREWLWFDS